ncbi:DUF7563 family protein [Halobaculum halobium]|uniref:DUF7563 family protein n=1 Tax=Halobaculum halobium TaxID=3032281 RepID=UPI003D80D16E
MPECTTCGNHVTEQFTRVFGDNRNVVRRCIECSRAADLDKSGETDERAHATAERTLTTWG